MEWTEIVSYSMGLAGALFGLAFLVKFQTAIRLLKELGELLTLVGGVLTKTSEALKDRKVTKAEAVLLLKSWQEVTVEFMDVYRVLCELLPAGAIKFLFKR